MIKIALLVSLIFFDLLTKYLIQDNLFLNQSITINEYFDLVYVQNFGVSFGLFSGYVCLLYTSPSPRDTDLSRMPSSA